MVRTVLVFAIACSSGGPPPSNPGSDGGSGMGSSAPPAVISDDAILEAVYLHEIKAADMKPDETACLRVRDANGQTGDASPALIAAVRAKFPRVAAASACTGGGFDPVRLIDPSGPAAMFDIGPVVRDAMGVRVKGGGAHRGGGSAREVEYTMTLSGSTATVASERLLITN